MKKGFLSKVKNVVYDIFHNSDYIKNFFFESDVKSNVFIGITVVFLELFMLLRVIFKTALSENPYDPDWVTKHICAYLVLLFSALVIVLYSLLYRFGKTRNRLLGKFLKDMFCIVSIAFGLYISHISLNPASQVFAFLTTEIFVLCIYVWTPLQALLISSLSFLACIYLQGFHGPVYYGTKINSFTSWVFLFT